MLEWRLLISASFGPGHIGNCCWKTASFLSNLHQGLFFLMVCVCLPSCTAVENADTQDEERNSTGLALQASYSTYRPTGPLRPPFNPFISSAKSEVLRREQQKKTQSFKMEELPGPVITDQQNFYVETKQEPDYVSTTTNFTTPPPPNSACPPPSSQPTRRDVFLPFPLFWCVTRAASDKMFWLAVPMVGKHIRAEGWHGMAASSHHGHVADPGQALVWPQGVRVPAALGANK